jgi:predicted O-linked N-acetylglucosamine transferase (SPINDLY family)
MTRDQEFERAIELQRQGRMSDAEALCREILEKADDDPRVFHLLGTLRFAAGARKEGVQLVKRALAVRPEYVEAEFNLGAMLAAMDRPAEAVEHYRRAADLRPEYVEAQARLASLLMELNRPAEAEAAFLKVLARRPEDRAALSDLTAMLVQQGKYEAAVAYGRRAVALAPEWSNAHLRLGRALLGCKKIDEAVAAFQSAAEIAAGPEAWINLALIWSDEGRASEAAQAFSRALALRPDDTALHSLLISAQELDPLSTPADRVATRRAWAERFADPITRDARQGRRDPSPGRRLRVGYVATDTFRVHTGATVLLPLIEAHDRSAVEVYCYSDTPAEWEDHVTARFRRSSVYRQVSGLSDERLASLIREDGIDVLVETYGHPPGSRLLAFARRPAPVQLCFQTMGPTRMAAVDHTIGDPILTPRSMSSQFREQVVRLPFAYLFDPLHDAPAVDPQSPFERSGLITFGSFNRWSKINDGVLAAWAEIFRLLPDARLILRSRPEIEPLRARFQRRLTVSGIGLENVTFLTWDDSAVSYLGDHNQVDLVLDTFPYGGGTTSCDALLMGVPVVTLISDRVLGRYSADFLHAVGLAELVTTTPAEYIATAVALAKDHGRRLSLRQALPARFGESRLRDGRKMARDMERVYRWAWRRWCASVKV